MLRVALIALAHGVTSTTVDLSQDWVVNTDANAEAALDAVVQDDILAYSLVHGGKIIAEYYRAGRDTSDTAAIWSVTKSWTSLLIGTLVKDGRLRKQFVSSTRSRSYTLLPPPMTPPPSKRPIRPPCRALEVVVPGIRHPPPVPNPAVGTSAAAAEQFCPKSCT